MTMLSNDPSNTFLNYLSAIVKYDVLPLKFRLQTTNLVALKNFFENAQHMFQLNLMMYDKSSIIELACRSSHYKVML